MNVSDDVAKIAALTLDADRMAASGSAKLLTHYQCLVVDLGNIFHNNYRPNVPISSYYENREAAETKDI